jgi:putative peptidoglycan lipid II flippase
VRREDYRATLILMAGFLAATATGFLREAALAHELGAGRATDIYLVAFALPEFFFLALPIVLSPAFIPLFADLRLARGEVAAWRFAWRVAGALLAFLVGAGVLLALGAPLILRWLGSGFDAGARAEAARALYRMLPAVILMGEATLAGAVLQVYRRFARPALATAIYNVTFVAVLLGAPLAWAAGRAAWGVTAGATAAFLLQISLVWRYRPAPASDVEPRGEEAGRQPVTVADVVRLAGPLAAGYAAHHLILFVDRAMATTLQAGAVATLNYGYRLALVVGQLSGLAVSTALFPTMAEQAAADDRPGLRSSLAAALRFVLVVGLPSAGILVVLRVPAVQVLFEHGAFDPAATAAVSQVVVWYALAVLVDALCQPLWRLLYARRSAWTVLVINSLQTGIRVLGNFALIGALGYNGLAISAVLGLGIQLLALGVLARRHLGAFLDLAWWRGALQTVVATALAVVVAGVAADQLAALPPPGIVLVAGALGGLSYILILWFLEKHTS